MNERAITEAAERVRRVKAGEAETAVYPARIDSVNSTGFIRDYSALAEFAIAHLAGRGGGRKTPRTTQRSGTLWHRVQKKAAAETIVARANAALADPEYVRVRREDAKELECLAIAEATMEGLAASRNPRGQRLLAIAARIKAALAREEGAE